MVESKKKEKKMKKLSFNTNKIHNVNTNTALTRIKLLQYINSVRNAKCYRSCNTVYLKYTLLFDDSPFLSCYG